MRIIKLYKLKLDICPPSVPDYSYSQGESQRYVYITRQRFSLLALIHGEQTFTLIES